MSELHDLEQRLNARFDAIDTRFDAIDNRFNAIDVRFETIDTRFNAIEKELAGVARNTDIRALTELLRQAITRSNDIGDQLRVVSATIRQLVGMVGSLSEIVQVIADRYERLSDRVRALEEGRRDA
jgi:predicted  nucleic acid-binding Zn-ribbon protein